MKNLIICLFAFFTTVSFAQNFDKKIESLYNSHKLEEGIDLINIEKGLVMFQSDEELLYQKMIHYLDWEGKFHVKNENLISAKKSYEEGIVFLNKKLVTYPTLIAKQDLNILESYADYNLETGNLWQAFESLRFSDSLRTKYKLIVENDNHNDFYLGKYYYITKDYNKSRSFFEKDILFIKNSNYSKQDLYRVAKAYNFLATIELEEGRPWISIGHAKQAYKHSSIDWIDKSIKNSYEEKIKAKNNISKSELLLGHLIEAKESSDDALRIFTTEKTDTSFEYLDLWMNRGEILWQLNLYVDAHHSFSLANEIQLEYVKNVIH